MQPLRLSLLLPLTCAILIGGCRNRYREDLDYSYAVQQTWPMEELVEGGNEIVQFESVFWEPDDTVSLRKQIVEDSIAAGRSVLEIGTGTGLLSILCLQNDATSVVATDINPAAAANARYNAAMLASDHTLDVRLVPKATPDAFAVIADDEKFDLILSNPPWEDGAVNQPADHAYYDPGFRLMDTLLEGLPQHLSPGGRCLLAYGHLPAIRRLLSEAERLGFETRVLDDRELDSLETDFLPGMLIEVRPPLNASKDDRSAIDPTDDSAAQAGDEAV